MRRLQQQQQQLACCYLPCCTAAFPVHACCQKAVCSGDMDVTGQQSGHSSLGSVEVGAAICHRLLLPTTTLCCGAAAAAAVAGAGYAFLEFRTHEAADMLLKSFNGQPIPGTDQVRVQRCTTSSQPACLLLGKQGRLPAPPASQPACHPPHPQPAPSLLSPPCRPPPRRCSA